MKPYEALELQAKAMRLVEGTELDWCRAIKHLGKPQYSFSLIAPLEEYELALAIVEGKPVFDGDTLYTNTGNKFVVSKSEQHYQAFANNYSWDAPKPRTVMVELPIEVVTAWTTDYQVVDINIMAIACRKALGELK